MFGISSPAPLRKSSSHGDGEEKSSTSEGAGEILLQLLDDDINFDDDIFVGFDVEYASSCDILPDLEIVDPADDIIFADFSFSSGSGSGSGEEEEVAGRDHGGNIVAVLVPDDSNDRKELDNCREQYLSLQNGVVISGSSSSSSSKVEEEEEEEEGSVLLLSAAAAESAAERSGGENRSGRKLSTTATPTKGSHGKKKKKAKVNWTPELHRRFVEAVEQLGVDKAVPSRILELMGVDSLTRHNIASHLQKYRSHRKHLLEREAEAARWSQRQQMYAGGGVMKRAVDHMKKHSWQAPPIAGFPPPPPPQMIRVPLHVWGHPSAAEGPQLVPVWPRHHLAPTPQPWLPSRPQPVVGPPPPMPHDPNSFWHPAHYQMALTQGMPFFPPQLLLPAMPRFQAPPVLPNMIQPHDHPLLIRPAPSSSHNAAAAAATTVNPTSPSSCIHSAPAVFNAHPSNEKIDAAIGDVLAKPWSALPLGLKPPTLECVMVELQRQGVAKVPPSSTSGGYS